MKPFFIGITGGSGSGKTALAELLKKKLRKRASILHVDNYQIFDAAPVVTAGMKNWDHPKSVDWEKLLKDLSDLKKGKKVVIESHSQKKLSVKEKPRIISFSPTAIVIIEGYLLFCKRFIRQLLDFSVYLEASDKTRFQRRTKSKKPDYVKKILLPMHRKYIEPTKEYADLILDTENFSVRDCVEQIINNLNL